MRELVLEYDDVEYRCRVSYSVVMAIENKVTLTELADRVAAGAAQGNVPVSHVVWCLYCLLQGAGCAVATVDEVFERVKTDKVPQATIVTTLDFILREVFGVGPNETLPNADEVEPATAEKKTAMNTSIADSPIP